MFYTHYIFWLALISLLCLLAERIKPWRKEQKLLRKEWEQDLFWLAFNGYFKDFIFAGFMAAIFAALNGLFTALTEKAPGDLALFSPLALPLQVILFLIISDFLEWSVHNMLHRVPVLWRIHRMHHSIKIMDWIGNFRFHWLEPVIYNTVKYLPLGILMVSPEAMLITAVISTTIGHLNHSNLNISWGPLRYILNSPRMHIWHHEKKLRGKAGVNFGIVFSLWDWLFGTAYLPNHSPDEIGFEGEEKVSTNLLIRFAVPWLNTKNEKRK